MSAGIQELEGPRSSERTAFDGPLDLVPRLTLVLTLLFPGDLWFHRIAMRILAVSAFIVPRLARSQWFWLLLFALGLLVQNLYNWAISDNHEWLFTYWYLALGLSLGARAPRATLARNGRLLIGLTFLFAALRKALAPDYWNGSAFGFLLQTDGRFYEVAKLLAHHSQRSHSIWGPMAELQPIVPFATSAALSRLATLLTWWTLGIEALIALAFLTRTRRPWFVALRNGLLLFFVATTYAVAPVLGFAWILLIMGLAQCPRSLPKVRIAYMAAFALVYAFQGEQIKMLICRWIFGREFYT